MSSHSRLTPHGAVHRVVREVKGNFWSLANLSASIGSKRMVADRWRMIQQLIAATCFQAEIIYPLQGLSLNFVTLRKHGHVNTLLVLTSAAVSPSALSLLLAASLSVEDRCVGFQPFFLRCRSCLLNRSARLSYQKVCNQLPDVSCAAEVLCSRPRFCCAAIHLLPDSIETIRTKSAMLYLVSCGRTPYN